MHYSHASTCTQIKEYISSVVVLEENAEFAAMNRWCHLLTVMRKQHCAPCYTVAVVTGCHCFIHAKLYVFCRPLPQVTPTSDTGEFLFHSMLVVEFSSVRHVFFVCVFTIYFITL